MQTSLETIGGLERRLNVSVPRDAIEGEIQKRLAKLARNVRLPGFRPGKVPRQMLERALGVDRSDPANPDPIYDDARDHLYRGSVIDALRTQAELDILEIPGRPEWASFSELSGARHQGALEAMTAAAAAVGIHHTTIQLEQRALADCPPDAVPAQ